MNLDEIVSVTKGKLVNKYKNIIINSFKTDTRKINKEDAFIALKGNNYDGSIFINDNLDCKLVITDKDIKLENIPVIKVDNTYDTLYYLTKYKLSKYKIPVIAITGSNGKTTTTTLTYNIMKEAFGDKVFLAGNIGFPLCSILPDVKSGDIIVMEVSCQQLENLTKFRPDVAVMTNLSPAHIDFLKSFENYKRVKAKLFQNQTEKDIAILNIDNEDVMNETKNIKSTTKYFSSKKEINGCYVKDNAIYYYGDKVISRDQIFIAGMHNVENCMAAIMVVKEFGVSNEIICKVISEFRGVEHRLEYVDTVNGVRFYNDTEATNIKCTQIALSSFDQPITLFLGGLERGQDFHELTPYMKNVSNIIAIGQCRDRVAEYGKELGIPTYVYEFLKDGFSKSVEVTKSNGIILLSPASASWDQYKECEVRGAEFKKKVEELKNEN